MNLTQDFEEAAIAYKSHLAHTIANAKKEIWSSGHYFHVEPFDFERGGFKQGTLLTKEPASTKQKYCYVFGKEDELLEIRQGLSIANQFNREFFFKENNILKSCLYGSNEAIINVKARVYNQNKVSEVFLLGKRGSKYERYFYSNDVLTHIRVEQWNANEKGVPYDAILKYEDNKLIEIVNKFDNGYEEVRYKTAS
jgi:hypothetical protein